MYFCGPTVYARAHIGNARPFVIGMWLRSWLKSDGLRREARPQHHRRQRQDLRRRAGRERGARRASDRVVPRGHGRPRARHARRSAEGDGVRAGDRRVHRGADRERARVRGRRRRLLPCRELPGLRPPLRPEARPGRAGRGAERAEGRPARLRALEGEQGRARTRRGSRRGAAAGRAGTSSARRWPRTSSGRRSRSTAAGSTSSSPTTRTSSRSRVRSAIAFASIWAHNGLLRFTGEKMSKSDGNVDHDPRGDRRRGGARRCWCSSSPATGASRSTSPRRRWRRRQARVETLPQRVHADRAEHEEQRWDAFADALEDDFDTPGALAVLHEWASSGQLELLKRGARDLRAQVARGARRGAAGDRRARRAAPAARGPTRLRGGRPAPRRARRGRLGDARPRRRLRPRAASVTRRPRLRPARRSRGAARPSRGARGLGDRAGARSRSPGSTRPRPSCRQERELTERADTRDHQGVVARVEPYRVRRRLRAGRRRAAAARRARPRHRPAQPRRRLPVGRGRRCDGHRRPGARLGRRHAGGRALVGRRDRAPADRGRHEPRALPRGGEGPASSGCTARPASGGTSMWDADLAGGVALVLRRRGEGPAPARPAQLRRARLDPAARRGRVAERQRRGGAAAVRGRGASAEMADASPLSLRRLQPPARRALRRPPRARRRARELRRHDAARAAWSSSTASATTPSAGRSRSASRRTPTRCSSGSRPSTASASGCCSSRSRRDRARARPGVRSRTSPRRPSSATSSPPEHRRRAARRASRGKLDEETRERLERLRRGE